MSDTKALAIVARGQLFAEHAPDYWRRGYSVIPIEVLTKQPAKQIAKGWTGYCDNLPGPEKQAAWLKDHSPCGIGLCLGTQISPGYRIGAVDVDDDAFVEVARVVLGPCPSGKRGKKGETFFVRVKDTIRSGKIVKHDKAGVIDVLMSGRQTVLPPSVHPDTRQPYAWIGAPLTEVAFDALPLFDMRALKLLRLVIGDEGVDALTAGVNTHDPGVKLVGRLVSFGCTDDEVEGIIRALLPVGYDGNSLDELPGWIEGARRKGYDEPKERKKKPPTAERLYQLVEGVGASLFRDDGDRGYFSVPITDGGVRHFPIQSSDAKRWLTKLYYDAERKVIGTRTLNEGMGLLEAKAIFEGALHTVYLRVGGTNERIVIDLGHDDGRVAVVTRDGWRLEYDPSTKLVRPPGYLPLPVPTRGGNLEALRTFLGLEGDTWIKVLAFLLQCLRPSGPYMFLAVEGLQDSGKSFRCQMIKQLIDPDQVNKMGLPNQVRTLMVQAKESYLLSYDNLSGMKGDIADALCILATGGGLAERSLYTNGERYVFNYTRPVILNGISEFITRPDLLNRSISVMFDPIQEQYKRTEAAMLEEFERIRPGILGALYDIVAGAIRNLPNVPAPTSIRMADVAQWLAACEPTVGLEPGTFIRTLADAQNEALIEKANNDDFVGLLKAMLEEGSIEGTVKQLFDHYACIDRSDRRNLPTSATSLGRYIRRMIPAMKAIGIHVHVRKDEKGSQLRIWREGEEGRRPRKLWSPGDRENAPY